jgi:ATP-dependent RNA helicase DeaD
MEEFSQMPLKGELVEALRKMNFIKPTEVQREAIPVVLKGHDVVVRAKTGTGKTGAFMIPIIEMLPQNTRHVNALIITPTRELALQVSEVASKMAEPLGFRTTTVYGGASINVQMDALRRGVNIVVGTPGRLIDLIERGVLKLDSVKFVVLDEADTMLDMGFIEDIEFILGRTPSNKQTMLFSATMPEKIISMSDNYMRDNKKIIKVGKEEEITAQGIDHYYAIANGSSKFGALITYIRKYQPKKAIVFTMTKRSADLLHRVLRGEGFDTVVMHGDLTQAKRERSLDSFKQGAQFMISTNIAARGLDIKDVTDVINFDAPDDPAVYVHRVGRSARMENEGRAFTLFSYEQRYLVNVIKRIDNIDMTPIHISDQDLRCVDIRKYLDSGRSNAYSDRGGQPRHFGGGRGHSDGRRHTHGGSRFHERREGFRSSAGRGGQHTSHRNQA